jgi:hypothetical protein
MLLFVSKIIPIKFLSYIPLTNCIYRYLLLGWSATNGLVSIFRKIIHKIPATMLKDRLNVMRSFSFIEYHSSLPTLYIQPLSDKLVEKSKYIEFEKCYNNIKLEQM